MAVQVGRIAETDQHGDLSDREVALTQQRLRLFYPIVDDVLVWRLSGGLFEQAGEVVHAHAGHIGNRMQREVVPQVVVNVLDRAAQLGSEERVGDA